MIRTDFLFAENFNAEFFRAKGSADVVRERKKERDRGG